MDEYADADNDWHEQPGELKRHAPSVWTQTLRLLNKPPYRLTKEKIKKNK